MRELKVYVVSRANFALYDDFREEVVCVFLTPAFAQALALIGTVFDFMHRNILYFHTQKNIFVDDSGNRYHLSDSSFDEICFTYSVERFWVQE